MNIRFPDEGTFFFSSPTESLEGIMARVSIPTGPGDTNLCCDKSRFDQIVAHTEAFQPTSGRDTWK